MVLFLSDIGCKTTEEGEEESGDLVQVVEEAEVVGWGEDGAEGLGELALEHRQVLGVVLLRVNDLRVRAGRGGLGCGR